MLISGKGGVPYFLFFVFCFLLLFSCKENKKYHDAANVEILESNSDAVNEILRFQAGMNAEFKDPKTSPLPDRYRADFDKLDFFQPDTNYRVLAKLVRTPEALPFHMPTTTDRTSEEVVYGIVHFYLNGSERQLEVYRSQNPESDGEGDDYLFLPFLDDTNGKETYGGGRYLDLSIPNGDSLMIDFNKAYNPYCAYNKKYSCPIVPKVNQLQTEVRAGVKAFGKF
ncbi:DUF1684 domain-containing protein [Flavobacteriaceae bacterium F89]|uniref:DUF1684 domain-containing protein n=1 Tax=Cerina litoralis TaxID=2874477 RepID=A0AAE3EX09_9FLAO|nr:DUF1684 domain-containing protein [Cerina litoralis]MCG2462040.1 DUF1684 domain-containing protein [Cerina litoralis]